MESVVINCVTEQFSISGRREAGQDDGGGDDGGGSVKVSLQLTHLISHPLVVKSFAFFVLETKDL